MKITIFGTGYVGLVTGACLADVGHEVLCVDIDEIKIAQLVKGVVPIYEPGLDDIVIRNVAQGRLNFTTNAEEAVHFGELQFIAVGTPPDEDGSADLQYVLAVANTIGKYMLDRKVIVDKSTVPVGTADKVSATIARVLDSRDVEVAYDVCSNPEFLKEGAAIEDFTKGSRIVIGTDSDHVEARMRECYAPLSRNHDKLIFMDIRSAELTKYAANAMLATKISFMNEMANLATLLGADIEQVRIGIGSDPRIGYSFIYPGCGYGGSCFPKDVQALIRTGTNLGYIPEVITSVERVNREQKKVLFKNLQSEIAIKPGVVVAVWGLSFKPNTDDMRDAPSRELIQSIWDAGGAVRVYDPKAMDEFKRIYGERSGLYYATSQNDALEGADALVICTEWKSFRAVGTDVFKRHLRNPLLIDGRNLYEPLTMAQAGIVYQGIGRKAVAL